MEERSCDVLITGGGLGGVAAALSVLRLGCSAVIAEPTTWLGGQLTSQGVPPDEHPWIEHTGASSSYRQFRAAVRDRYRRRETLTARAQEDPFLNPGRGWVSALCHEPKVGASVLSDLLAPYERDGGLQVLFEHRATAASVDADRVTSVQLRDPAGASITVTPRFVLDATEEGNLLPLTGCEHVVGAESQADTGEPHARAEGANPLEQQAVTWCFALEYEAGADHSIPRPKGYNFWREYRAPFWPGPHLGWDTPDPITGRTLSRPLFSDAPDAHDLWTFRRLLCGAHHEGYAAVRDVTLVNWPQNDYWLGPIVGVPETVRAAHLFEAKELGSSLLYWLQHDAPRPDGDSGYPGLRLRPDILGSPDGFAMHPYVRESRRIKACFTVLETHVGVEARGPVRGAEPFSDSVGIGSYRIDLHPTTGGRGYVDIASWPFQIPLGALVPVRMRNLLPAGKNLGVTHVTNGCFRLHPIEWNVGEVAGALAASCINAHSEPQAVLEHRGRVAEFQKLITDLGVLLSWPEHIRLTPR
jgi:hypothetical protein